MPRDPRPCAGALPPELDDALRAALDGLAEVAAAAGVWIALDLGGGLQEACRREGASSHPTSAPPGWSESVARDALETRSMAAGEDEGRAVLAVPLPGTSGVRGVIGVTAVGRHRYSARDGYAVTAAASGLDAAILELRSRPASVTRSRLLLDAAQTINSSLESSTLEMTILAEAARLVAAPRAALLTVRGDVLVATEVLGLDDRCLKAFVVPLEGSVFGRALLQGDAIAVEDAAAAGGAADPSPCSGTYASLLVAPLHGHRMAYGVLALFFDEPRRFGEDEKSVVRTFAIHAAIALDNRRLMLEKDQMAVHDGLTGVYNRSYLGIALSRIAQHLRRNGGVASVLFLDVDGMKEVNDSGGHQAGDQLLVALASLLQSSCRGTDVVARYGGDEFVVLMPDTDEEGAHQVALKIEGAIAQHGPLPGGARLSVSTGLNSAGPEGVDDLLREADRRMYESKRTRR